MVALSFIICDGRWSLCKNNNNNDDDDDLATLCVLSLLFQYKYDIPIYRIFVAINYDENFQCHRSN